MQHLLLAGRNAEKLERRGLQLESEGFTVHRTTLLRELPALTESYPVCAALLDLDLGKAAVFAALRRMGRCGGPFIALCGANLTVQQRIEALREGADEVFDDSMSAAELAERLRAFFRRAGTARETQCGAVLQYGDLRLDTDSLALRKGKKTLAVTLAEYKLLVKLMRAPGKTFTKSELYEYISCGAGESAQNTRPSDDNTVMVHISRLREKIEDDPRRPVYIKTVRARGYRFEIPE